jgi:hypothetical protein
MSVFDFEKDHECASKSKFSYCEFQNQSSYNSNLHITGTVFGFIFTLEACLKIFALGFCQGKKTYLNTGWNVLDFVIVVCGLLEFANEQFF